ncbi:MAG: hypothetical protein U5M23_06365 [Marinagarivorans sp.]|nr:hypothetical protein [Marinagarivorans sp.]
MKILLAVLMIYISSCVCAEQQASRLAGMIVNISDNERTTFWEYEDTGKFMERGADIPWNFYISTLAGSYFYSENYHFILELESFDLLKFESRWRGLSNDYRVISCQVWGDECFILAVPNKKFLKFDKSISVSLFYSEIIFSKTKGLLGVIDYYLDAESSSGGKLKKVVQMISGDIFSVSPKKIGMDPSDKIKAIENRMHEWPSNYLLDLDGFKNMYPR